MKNNVRSIGIVCLMIAAVTLSYGISSSFMNMNSLKHKFEVEKNCICHVDKAEIWQFIDEFDWDSLEYVQTVTSIVEYVDSNTVSFNKNYVLRVYFSINLTAGDSIIIYAKWNTVPNIKNVTVFLTNGTKVGEGEVLPHYNYYYLNITGNISSKVFDIALDGGNPSSHKIYIDQVKCAKTTVPEWHDPETGDVIYDYQVILYYIAYINEHVDENNIYVDLLITQRIIDSLSDTMLIENLVIRDIFRVTSIGISQTYYSQIIPLVSHDLVGVDNITIFIDVKVTLRGKLNESEEWIVINKEYDAIRNFSAIWY